MNFFKNKFEIINVRFLRNNNFLKRNFTNNKRVKLMIQSNEKNTIQVLTDICGEYKQIADSLRVPTTEPLVNDIPDIYDNAASLLTTIITCKAGFDPNTNILKQASEYESSLISAEKSFMKKMEESMNLLASKVEDSQDQYKQLGLHIESALNEIPQIFEKALSTIEKKNAYKLIKYEDELNKKSAEYATEEQKLKENFKVTLSEHLKKVDDEWNQKVKNADTEISNLQKELHLAIHSKQENNLAKTEEIRHLEKLNAIELENESNSLKEIKNDELKILEALNSQLEKLNQKAEEESQKAKKISEDLEMKMMEEKKAIIEAHNKELQIYEDQKKEVLKKLKNTENEYEQRKAASQLKMKETEQSYEGKLLQEKDLTQRKIDEVNEKLSHEYVPILNILNQRIIKAEQQRGISLEQLHKSSLETTESNESEIIEMNKRHQEERTKLRAEIRQEKQKLQDILNEREIDVDQLKRDLEKQVQDQEKEFENREKKHQKQISEMLVDFEQLQREYDEDKKRRIEEKNKKKVVEVERLKNEHQLRVNELIYQMEQKTIIDCEKAYNDGIKEAQVIHQTELGNIKTRINEYNKNMEEIRESMILLKIKHEERLKTIENNKMAESEERKAFLRADFEQEINFFIQQKRALLLQLKMIKKKKAAVEGQFEEVKNQLDELSLSGPILSPLDILRQSFNNVLAEMRHQEGDLVIDKRNLEKSIGELQNSVDEIGKKVEDKEQEMDQFLKAKQEKLNGYFDSARKNLERLFENAKNKPIEFENVRNKKRKEIDDEIADLQKDILQLRKETELESENISNLNEKKIKEIENKIQLEFESRLENLREQHNISMEKMKQELESLKKSHENNMNDIQKKFDEDSKEIEIKFKKRKNELLDEKKNLFLQEKNCQDKLEDTPIPQCTDCNNRRQTIDRLSCRRNELLDRLDEISNISIQNDQKIASMFPQRIGANSNSKSSLSITHSPRVPVLRTKSSLKKTIVTPY